MKFLSTKIRLQFIKVIIVVLIIFCGGFLVYSMVKKDLKKEQQQNTKIEAINPLSDEVRCSDQFLLLDEAKKKVNNNQKAISILKEKCLALMWTESEDFDGDGKKEILMSTSGAGCGSCHGQEIFIVKGNEVIFDKLSDDPEVHLADKYIGFEIKEPIRDKGPMCCPSEGTVQSYRLRKGGKGLNTFYKFAEIVYSYRPQRGGKGLNTFYKFAERVEPYVEPESE